MTVAIPPAGAHGGDGAALAAALGIDPAAVLDLSASLNPAAPDVGAIVGKHLHECRRYPDPRPATAALAAALGVDPGRVVLTNGGAQAIALVGAEIGGSVREPEFSLYPRAGGPRWRSNPHSPSGRLAPPTETAAVWDEAFYPLATGRWTRGDADHGAVVVGSLTKVFACPGLRVGYVVAPDAARAEGARRRQPAWSVNGLAAAAVPDLLANADLATWAALVAQWRSDLVALLVDHGLAPEPSDANFILVRAPGLRERLARQGVLVRDCANFGLPDHVRIAVPAPDALRRVHDALTRLDHAPGAPAGLSPPPQPSAAQPSAAQPSSARPRPGGAGAGPERLVGALMVCGTASDVGKSHVVAGLCRVLHRRGVRVAPFKAQNMALNSYVTTSGHEIGRAQAVQALAAGAAPEVAMNPILLKPTGERTSQVVVMGRPVAHLDAAAYHAHKPRLAATVLAALADLRARFDVVILEGAGSPAEINLLDRDIVNLRVAAAAGIPALVVGDIDRGGVFAALYGTVALLPHDLRPLVQGLVVNKLRGDPALLGDAAADLERRCGVPVLGVLPYLRDVALDAEDSLALAGRRPEAVGPALGDPLDVAAIRLPRIANFTDLDALALEPGVSVRLVDDAGALGQPDLIVVPGTKATVSDLDWLRGRGLGPAIWRAHASGATVVGICGGLQMLGHDIVDGLESDTQRARGLGWLEVDTAFEATKVTRQRRGRAGDQRVSGYQIHHGRVTRRPGAEGWVHLDDGYGREDDGAVAGPDGGLLGTSLHGLFEEDGFRSAFLRAVGDRRGKQFVPAGISFRRAREAQLDRLADAIEAHLDLGAVDRLIAAGGAPR